MFLQYFDTVGWVFWPVQTVSHITYTVLAGMLTMLSQSPLVFSMVHCHCRLVVKAVVAFLLFAIPIAFYHLSCYPLSWEHRFCDAGIWGEHVRPAWWQAPAHTVTGGHPVTPVTTDSTGAICWVTSAPHGQDTNRSTSLSVSSIHSPSWALKQCRISPPCFLAECCKRQLNQSSFVLPCLPFLGCA